METLLRAKRLIVVLTPGNDLRVGGILSIHRIYRETLMMERVHRARVALCVLPGDPALAKYTWFENDDYLLDFATVLASAGRLRQLLVHIPEYAVNQVVVWLQAHPESIAHIRAVHLNVLVQNIDLVAPERLSELHAFGKVTCTAAHESYTTPATRDMLGVPLHGLSVRYGSEQYPRTEYHEKEQLLVVSHDEHPLREEVLQHIADAHPDLTIQIVHDLSYETYRALIGRAKWSLTFGEGLDSYFTEEIWSGGVAFAVFNDRFFTPAFASLENVYPSWQVLLERINTDMQRLDNPTSYTECWRSAFDLLDTLYSVERFRANLRAFYRGDYSLPWASSPSSCCSSSSKPCWRGP